MSKKKQTPQEFYVAKLKQHREEAITSLNQSARQTTMLEGAFAFLNQAIDEAEKGGNT